MSKKDCFIFGASSLGEYAYHYLREKINILAFVDNDEKKWGSKINGLDIIAPAELVDYKKATVIIASIWYIEIARQIYEIMGNEAKIAIFKIAVEDVKTDVDLRILCNSSFSNDIFKKFAGYVKDYIPREGFAVNYLNIATNIAFKSGWNEGIWKGFPDIVRFSENFLEESCILESVLHADTTFKMIELGAGYGGWLVTGAIAAALLNKTACLMGVEGDKTHFQWMKQHFVDNGLNIEQHKLINGVVYKHDGEVDFEVGDEDPSVNYSQWVNENSTSNGKEKVKSYTLNSLLEEFDNVDLIDMDIQGAEFDVLNACDTDILNKKVKKIYIGTHRNDLEILLRDYFNKLGWKNIYDFEHLRSYTTEFGSMTFNDGVQLWTNPRFI